MSYEQSPPDRSRTLADGVGHHAPKVLVLAILAVIAVGLHPLPGLLELVVPGALLVVVIASWMLLRRHDRRLCEPCMSAMPLNPSQAAARYRRRFELVHVGADPRRVVPYFAVLIGSNFIPGLVGRVIWTLAQASMIYLILAYTSHRKLQPWCPWCQGGGGGLERHDDPVTPNPSDRLQLT